MLRMRRIRAAWRASWATLAISLVLLLVVDFFLGERLLGLIDVQSHEKKYRISHPVYHHTLAPGYDGSALSK